MMTRPTIFISSVSRELRSARQLVANTLQFLGYEPVWQDVFGTEQGDLRQVLRRKIDESKGVVQLVGQCYGAEPTVPDDRFGRVSYTQYEALYARECGKKVWYLFLDENFPPDVHEPEPKHLRELQATYRHRLQSQSHLYHPLNSREALEASVLKLRDDLTRLRRGVKQWGAVVVAIVTASLGVSVWQVLRERDVSKRLTESARKQDAGFAQIKAEIGKERMLLARVLQRAQDKNIAFEQLTAKQRFDLALEDVARQEKQPAADLRAAINLFISTVEADPGANPLDRALAAMGRQEFGEAASLAREVATDAIRTYRAAAKAETQLAEKREGARKRAIEAYALLGHALQSEQRYGEALQAFQEGAALTDRSSEPILWAEQRRCIAAVLFDQGKLPESAQAFRNVLEVYEVFGPQDEEVLSLRGDMAALFAKQGHYSAAERECREVLDAQMKVLGPEDPGTFSTRNNLAVVFYLEGKYALAKQEHEKLIGIETRTLGRDHPTTLLTRNNFALALYAEGLYAEAETELRQLIELEIKSLGIKHPTTLLSRNTLVLLLHAQARNTEAEAEDRGLIDLATKVLGPEHPSTLLARNNLGLILQSKGEYVAAEIEYRDTLELQTKVLGTEHPDALLSRHNLAIVAHLKGNFNEAESESRHVVDLEMKALGPEHPTTLASRNSLALALAAQEKFAEAKSIWTDVLQMQSNIFGPEHPVTLETRSNIAFALGAAGQSAEAEEEFTNILKVYERTLGAEHPTTLKATFGLALFLEAQKKLNAAKVFAERAASGAVKTLGTNHPVTSVYQQLYMDLLKR